MKEYIVLIIGIIVILMSTFVMLDICLLSSEYVETSYVEYNTETGKFRRVRFDD